MSGIVEQLGASLSQTGSLLSLVNATHCYDLAVLRTGGMILALMGWVVTLIWMGVRRSSAL